MIADLAKLILAFTALLTVGGGIYVLYNYVLARGTAWVWGVFYVGILPMRVLDYATESIVTIF